MLEIIIINTLCAGGNVPALGDNGKFNSQSPCSRRDCISEAVREAPDRKTNEQIIADGEDNTTWWCNQEWLQHGRPLGRGDISSETWQGGANHHPSLTVGISLKDVVSRQSGMRLVEWEGSSEDKDSLLPCRTGSNYPSWQHGAQGSRVLSEILWQLRGAGLAFCLLCSTPLKFPVVFPTFK